MINKIKRNIGRIIKSKLLKDSGAYTILNVVEKLVPFFILPIITRILTKEEVGLYILYQAIIQILIPLMTLNTDSAVLLSYYKEEKNRFTEYFSNAIVLFAMVFTLILSILFIFSDEISSIIKFPSNWLLIVSGIVVARYFTQLRQHIWRIKYRIKEYSYFTIGISFVKNSIGLLLVIFFSYNWEGLIIGHLIGYSIFGLVALYTFHTERIFNFKLNILFIKDAFYVGYPLSIHKIGTWFGNAANRIIIASILGTAATGSYGVGATFAVIVTMFEDAFNKAFMPHLFQKLKKIHSNDKNKLVRLTYSVYLFLIVISAILYIIGYYGVGLIFGAEYHETREFMLPLVIAAMINGFYKLHVNYIMFTKKTIKITQISISTGILNLILAYSLTVSFGIIGAAYSLLLTKAIQYLLTFYVGNNLIPLPWFSFMLGNTENPQKYD